MGRKLIPMEGKTFGPLTVIEQGTLQRAGWTWVCWCLWCGRLQERLGSHLRSGYRSSCRACGSKEQPPHGWARYAKPSDKRVAAFKEHMRRERAQPGKVAAFKERMRRERAQPEEGSHEQG